MSTGATGLSWDGLICQSPGLMAHPGLPLAWVVFVLFAMSGLFLWTLRPVSLHSSAGQGLSAATLPVLGPWLRGLLTRPWFLLGLKLVAVTLFLMVISAGLFGTPIPERNLATTLTWTLWWSGLIISVYFVGSAWCAVCPWDALATWLVNLRLWGRGDGLNRLQLRVPKHVRNVWPALWMFIGLTWLELGAGVTTSPYATAVLALVMLVLTVTSLAVFERKAFCRYFCSVGRTVGFYAQMSPVALRPVDPDVCAACKTLECYHGSAAVEPCPTHLVMGRLKQNTYCTSCGDCTQSCPYQNVAWRVRPAGEEVVETARPHWDEAWFILGLVALTSFHGMTMMPFWEQWMSELARLIGDSGRMLWSFSIGMFLMMAVPVVVFALSVLATRALLQRHGGQRLEFKRVFSALAIPALPLAFAYHLAHNINHLAREGRGLTQVFLNPLGRDTQPLSEAELHLRHLEPLIPQGLIFALQAGLILFGFWLATRILRTRAATLIPGVRRGRALRMLPVMLFVLGVSLFNLWLLMQPMVMRF